MISWAELGRIIKRDHSLGNITLSDLKALRDDLSRVIEEREKVENVRS